MGVHVNVILCDAVALSTMGNVIEDHQSSSVTHCSGIDDSVRMALTPSGTRKCTGRSCFDRLYIDCKASI